MDKYIALKLTKMTLLLTEQEIIKALPQNLLMTGLQRGKGFMRGQRVEQWERSGNSDENKTGRD